MRLFDASGITPEQSGVGTCGQAVAVIPPGRVAPTDRDILLAPPEPRGPTAPARTAPGMDERLPFRMWHGLLVSQGPILVAGAELPES